MEVRILGPFAITHGGASIPISGSLGPKALIVLLSSTGNMVSIDGFVDALWDDDPPATARRQVTNTLASLRRIFDPLAPALLQRRSGTYRLGECDLDARRFDELVRQAWRERDSIPLSRCSKHSNATCSAKAASFHSTTSPPNWRPRSPSMT